MANGGARNNTYQVSTSSGDATIKLPTSAGSKNELDFTGGVADNQLWFLQSRNDLRIDLVGTQSDVLIKNWSGGSNQLREITAGGLKLDSQVAQLVQAMATYSAANSGFDPTAANVSTLPNDTNPAEFVGCCLAHVNLWDVGSGGVGSTKSLFAPFAPSRVV